MINTFSGAYVQKGLVFCQNLLKFDLCNNFLLNNNKIVRNSKYVNIFIFIFIVWLKQFSTEVLFFSFLQYYFLICHMLFKWTTLFLDSRIFSVCGCWIKYWVLNANITFWLRLKASFSFFLQSDMCVCVFFTSLHIYMIFFWVVITIFL